jgi:hypothetical protein
MIDRKSLGQMACLFLLTAFALIALFLWSGLRFDPVLAFWFCATAAVFALGAGIVAWRTRPGKIAVMGGGLFLAALMGWLAIVYYTILMVSRGG